MKVLSASGAERRPIPRAAALSRVAPPPKVFSLLPPPGTVLGPRPSKYLPQLPGRSWGHSKAPPGPRASRSPHPHSHPQPSPARSPFAAGGHREKRREVCAPPAAGDCRVTHPHPLASHRKSTVQPIASQAAPPSPPRLDGSPLSGAAPAGPAASHAEFSGVEASVVCPQAGLDLKATTREGSAADLEREQLMWDSNGLSRPTGWGDLPGPQTQPGASWKMEEAPPRKQVPQGSRGTTGLGVEKVQGSEILSGGQHPLLACDRRGSGKAKSLSSHIYRGSIT